jgi:TetR/AcrR family transcriptional regulator
MAALDGRVRRSYGGSVDSLYERLPHGPHRLGHDQVTRNQRIRLYGAMVEAVAASGYERASVRQVVALAGVSRRSFYELFANKQECFLATFDMVSARGVNVIRQAYQDSDGTLEDRLGATYRRFLQGVGSNWKGARLTIVEAQTVVPAGLERMQAATKAYERMLSATFTHVPGADPLPMPVVTGIVGGLHSAVSTVLREGRPHDLPPLAESMLGWTLLFQSPAAMNIPQRPLTPLTPGAAAPGGVAGANVAALDPRDRLLHHVLRLALIEDYKELSAPQIADEAGVSIDTFFELFAGKNECYVAALDRLGNELLELVTAADLLHGDWPRAVRRVITELMRYLGERPLYAQTLAAGAFAAGPGSAARLRDIGRSVSMLLAEGAPAPARTAIALEGMRGAIRATIRSHVSTGTIERLPVASGHLSYLVLAPFIGADVAAEIASEAA